MKKFFTVIAVSALLGACGNNADVPAGAKDTLQPQSASADSERIRVEQALKNAPDTLKATGDTLKQKAGSKAEMTVQGAKDTVNKDSRQ